MKRVIAGILLLLASAGVSRAQAPVCPSTDLTCPQFTYGFTPTPQQWQNWWNSRQAALNYTPVNRAGDTMSGKLNLLASTAATAGTNIGQGTGPSSPTNGDIWITSSGFYFRVAGVTVGPINSSGMSQALTSGHIFVGNVSGVATDVAMSGGATINNSGVVTLTQFNSTTPGAVSASGGGTTNFLRADGTWTVPSGSSGANPTATAGPTAINGVASSFMRSDAAPAIQLATSGQKGIVQGDGSTLSIASGIISCTTGAVGQKGCLSPDGSSITAASGVISTGSVNVMGATCTPGGSECIPSRASAFLAANVALNNTSAYFDGPSMAQGSTGVWWAVGAVTLVDVAQNARFFCKLYDGTTVYASGGVTSGGASYLAHMTLSAMVSSPAGNLRIACEDASTTSGTMYSNVSGFNADSFIWGMRIQ